MHSSIKSFKSSLHGPRGGLKSNFECEQLLATGGKRPDHSTFACIHDNIGYYNKNTVSF